MMEVVKKRSGRVLDSTRYGRTATRDPANSEQSGVRDYGPCRRGCYIQHASAQLSKQASRIKNPLRKPSDPQQGQSQPEIAVVVRSSNSQRIGERFDTKS